MLPADAGMILPEDEQVPCRDCAPRGCGDDPHEGEVNGLFGRVLPADAGMIPWKPRTSRYSGCAPRGCGDDPNPSQCLTGGVKCSPRMRG